MCIRRLGGRSSSRGITSEAVDAWIPLKASRVYDEMYSFGLTWDEPGKEDVIHTMRIHTMRLILQSIGNLALDGCG